MQPTPPSQSPSLDVLHCQPAPDSPGRRTTLVLVHGSWHGAWTWEDSGFQTELAARGYASIAPSLHGHGDQSAPEGIARSEGTVGWGPSLDRYAEDIERTINTHIGMDTPFVLVVHSLAGRITLHYLMRAMRRRGSWPKNLAGIVFMCAVPPLGVLPSTLRLLSNPDHRDALLSAFQPILMLQRPNMQRVIETWQRAHGLFRHTEPLDSPEAIAHMVAFHARLGDESILGYIQTLLPTPFTARSVAARLKEEGIPILVMGGESEPIIHLEEVRQTARYFGTEDYSTLTNVSHDLMYHIGRADVADAFFSWLNRVDEQQGRRGPQDTASHGDVA